jgi:hypothetical protein
MKNLFFFVVVMSFSIAGYSQVEPPLPSPCYSYGPGNKNNLTVTGNTTFTFSDIAAFDGSQSFNTITINVKSSQGYKLYIAGEMTSPVASSTNTPIPINTFTLSTTNRGTSPATVTLSNSYMEVAQYASSTNGRDHVLTITRNALNDFVQAPGNHTLTLHIRYCHE